ncbi:GIY-YIG nuclease family protein [Synergistes jonesii]|uniref:GIY-YIG nuclease family protein n=1 Tax=Synergistes jonesii TaxID=2754 RepID=UPI00248E08AB|nr:GIY-YIG nuclease family protein [Synergistes jonesii]
MNKEKKTGVIYILTNPSFPDYVKIGYASDIEKRLKQLNQSECMPFAFRVYAVYEVAQSLQDKELHSLIDRLNPELRAIDSFDGKTRTKEFYAMSAEGAYALLESIAKLSGTTDKLQRLTPEGHEIIDEEVAAEIQAEAKERKSPFSFSKCGIPIGAELTFVGRPDIVATVKEDRQIEYQGEPYSLSSLAQKILQTPYPLQGPVHWIYQGRKLWDIRIEREEQGLYQ